MDDTAAHSTEPGWASAWAAALDGLELSLDEAESMLRGEEPPGHDPGTTVAPWAPPALEGPMPVDLRTRALALHHRQHRVLRETAVAAAALRRQTGLLSRMSTARPDSTPVYLDVTA